MRRSRNWAQPLSSSARFSARAPDLLPPEYIAELQKLQDAVPAVPTSVITARIEAELGRPVRELFTAFDPVPLAAASIAQVHAVTLPGGIDAVVKVQRPGVRERVMLDLEIAGRIARLAEERLNIAERTGIHLPQLVDEFGWTLRNELDYLREAKNAEVFQRNFAENAVRPVPGDLLGVHDCAHHHDGAAARLAHRRCGGFAGGGL